MSGLFDDVINLLTSILYANLIIQIFLRKIAISFNKL